MNCRSTEPLLSAFLEDDLSQKERRSLEVHLLACRRCSLTLRELRATLELVQDVPEMETSPHFEEDLLARVRSGEALRPTVIEWLRGYLEPARLRPLFLAGAGACAVWIGVMLADSQGILHRANPSRVAENSSVASVAARSAVPAPATSGETAKHVLASGAAPSTGSATTVAERPSVAPARPQTSPSRGSSSTGYAWAESDLPATRTNQDSTIPNPGARYDDQYITDQFFLERGLEGSGNKTITPVSDRPSDDVFITF